MTGKRVGTFASELEAKVFMILCEEFDSQLVGTQHCVTLTANVKWKIDFAIPKGEKDTYLIEAKGFPPSSNYCREFKMKLKLLGDLHPDMLKKFLIVTPDEKSMRAWAKWHKNTTCLLWLPNRLRSISHLQPYRMQNS